MTTTVKVFLQVTLKILAVGLGILTLRWFNNTDYVPKLLADEYSKIIALNTVLCGFLALALPNVIQKIFTNQNDKQVLSNTLFTVNIVRLITLLVGIVLVTILFQLNSSQPFIFDYLKISHYGFFLGLFVSQFFLFSDLNFRSVADTTGRSWIFSLTDFLSRLTYVLCLYSFITLVKPSVEVSIAVILVSGFIANFGTLLVDFFIYTKGLPKPSFDFSIINANVGTIIYIGIVGAFIGLFSRLDTVLLSGEEGLVRGYSAAFQIFETIQVVPIITMPVLATYLKRKGSMYLKSVAFTIFCGLALALLSIVGSQFLLYITKASVNYPSSTQVMWIFVIGIIPTFFNNLLHHLNILHNKEKLETIITIINGLIILTLYFVFIPIYGIFAAAYISVLGMFIDMILKLGVLFTTKYYKQQSDLV